MISTSTQVKTRWRALLDDDAGATFTDAVFTEAYGEAREALNAALLRFQIPGIEKIVTYTLAANTTSLDPAVAGISDFGELIELEERASGSTERYVHVKEVDKLPQWDAGTALNEFVWRLDTLYFVGATQARELRITYWDTGVVPESGSTVIDGARTFLAKYAAGAAGPRKGYDYAETYMAQAVGGNYPERIGGELYALLEPMVRSRQRVPIAPRPYTVRGRLYRNTTALGTYVSAAGLGGDAAVPNKFSLFAGNITGTVDGVNATFYLSIAQSEVDVRLNGAALTEDQHFTHAANVITFLPPFIPKEGADMLVLGWN